MARARSKRASAAKKQISKTTKAVSKRAEEAKEKLTATRKAANKKAAAAKKRTDEAKKKLALGGWQTLSTKAACFSGWSQTPEYSSLSAMFSMVNLN